MNNLFDENDAIKRSKKNLREYQKNVIEYMKTNDRLLVFHKMGTGKTLTAITVSQSYLDQYPKNKVIVISPATLTDNFKKEMFLSYKNLKHINRYSFFSIQKATNLLKEKKLNCKNSLIIIDEVHNYRTLVKKKKGFLKSGKNVFYIKPCIAEAHKVLLLTGTPVYNSPTDLENLKTFLKTDDLRCMISYHNYEKDDINFPQRIDIPVFIRMSSEYEEQYNKIMDELYCSNEIERLICLRVFETDSINGLQYFANAIRRATQNLDSTLENNKKLEYINTIIQKIHKKNKKRTKENQYKMIIYSAYKKHGINLVKEMIPNDDYLRHDTISGDTKMSERQKKVRLYNEGKIHVLFLTKAGGEGLDLKGTDFIMIMEPNWNENGIEQVVARGIRFQSHEHREAKRKIVRVLRLYHVKEFDQSDKYLNSLKKEIELLEKSHDFKTNGFHIYKESSCDEIMRSYSFQKQVVLKKVEKHLKDLSIENNDCSNFTVSRRTSSESNDYEQYEVKELMKQCRDRNIPLITVKTNNKQYLIKKLVENDKRKLSKQKLKEKSVRELVSMCRERKIPLKITDGVYNKNDLIKKLIENHNSKQKSEKKNSGSSTDLNEKTVAELLAMCRERKIPLSSHRKSFLINKLENYKPSSNKKRSTRLSKTNFLRKIKMIK